MMVLDKVPFPSACQVICEPLAVVCGTRVQDVCCVLVFYMYLL
jgi:hypothetical protein